MQHGFIKTAAASPEIKVADPAFNTGSIISVIQKAHANQVKLLVLPELCLSGYTCGDLFHQKLLLDACAVALSQIAESCKGLELLVTLGLPLICDNLLYNCAAVIYQGEILGIVPKTHLPNYNEFYEKRHFTSAKGENRTINLCGKTIPFGTKLLFTCKNKPELCLGIEICEDLWVPSPPSVSHTSAGATIIANLSASDEIVGKPSYRRGLVKSASASMICGYIFASAGEGESTTDVVFSGHCMISENGNLLAESNLFESQMIQSEIDVERLSAERRKINTYTPEEPACGYDRIYFDLPEHKTVLSRYIDPHPFIPSEKGKRDERCEEIFAIQANGLKKRIKHTSAKCLVVGISGGLDSCLALLVCVRAMDLLNRPHSDIIAVTMPCFGTTARTKNNATLLCERLSVTLREIDITKSVLCHFEDIGQSIDQFDVTYENGQARERTQVLMDLANKEGGFVIGTGDLSELALGWATYNGDHMSMYGVNASVPKTLIRHMVNYVSDSSNDTELSKILDDILATPVSPELLPAIKGEISQKTEDLVGPYELHDFFLYYFVRFGFSPDKIYRLATIALGDTYDDQTIRKWLQVFLSRFFSQQFKRSCIPDGPKVGSVVLSPRGDWRMPSDASNALWKNLKF